MFRNDARHLPFLICFLFSVTPSPSRSPNPARATVQVAGLPKGGRVAIEMIAKVR